MPSFTNVGLVGQNHIDSLVFGTKWGGALGTGQALTYSFSDFSTLWDSPYGADDEPLQGFSALTAGQQAAAASAFQLWANVANVTFTEVFDDNLSAFNGDIRFSGFDASLVGRVESGHAYFPGADSWSADIWLDNQDYTPAADVSATSFLYHVIVHEIGHSIGLTHPDETGISTLATAANDWLGVTVLSSKTFSGADPAVGGFFQSVATRYPSTPMMNDIATAQYLYGPNNNYNSGNDTYSWTNGQGLLETIWDGGGTDTIDTSNQSSAVVINLNEGAWSEIGPSYDVWNSATPGNVTTVPATVAIAFGAVIENAIGTSQADVLVGNAEDNDLDGGGGDDTLNGSVGADTLTGGGGSDTASYANAFSAVFVNLASPGANLGEAAGDVYSSIENLLGSNFDDALFGNASANVIEGGSGKDVILGGDGNDGLLGGANRDAIAGQGGFDWISGGDARDNISGDAGNDTIFGGNGIDTVLGGDGDDSIEGNEDNDELDGGNDNDFIDGGAGNDRITGGAGLDTVNGGADSDLILGGTGNDSLSGGDGDDAISGELDDDEIFGNNGNDTLFGHEGNDTILGGIGNETMIGGFEGAVTADNDSLDGGDGADAVSGAFGDDTILGGNGNDLLFGGQDGNDSMDGGAGDDTVFGHNGDDTIIGGTGSDILRASKTPADNDLFVFNVGDFANGESDLVILFDDDDANGESMIEISGFGFADLAAFLLDPNFDIVQNGTDTDILMGAAGGKITLFNFTATDLDASDFIFS